MPSGSFTLIASGCLHYPIGDLDLIKAFIERVKSVDDAHVLLMGDTTDFARANYRLFLEGYKSPSDNTSPKPVEEYAAKLVLDMVELLRPIKNKIDGVVLGNHFFTFPDGVNTEQKIAHELGFDYLGPTAFLRYDLGKGRGTAVKVFAVHKFGGSTTPTGAVTALLRQERVADADLVMSSHSHDRIVVPLESLDITGIGNAHIGHRTRLLVKTGAFLKTYKEEGPIPTDKPHRSGYGEGLYRPTSLGWIEIKIGTRKAGPITIPTYEWSGKS